MRQITKDSVAAFFAGKELKRQNTEVRVSLSQAFPGGKYVIMYLYGNQIAKREIAPDGTEELFIRDAGWRTATTKDRLHAVVSHVGKGPLYQRKGEWYLGEEKFPFNTFVKVMK